MFLSQVARTMLQTHTKKIEVFSFVVFFVCGACEKFNPCVFFNITFVYRGEFDNFVDLEEGSRHYAVSFFAQQVEKSEPLIVVLLNRQQLCC